MHLSQRLARQVGENSRSSGVPGEKLSRKLPAHTLVKRQRVGKRPHCLPGAFERHDLYAIGTNSHADRIGNRRYGNSFFRHDTEGPPSDPAFSIICPLDRRDIRRREVVDMDGWPMIAAGADDLHTAALARHPGQHAEDPAAIAVNHGRPQHDCGDRAAASAKTFLSTSGRHATRSGGLSPDASVAEVPPVSP
jgi:hypothetical protein